MATRGMEGMAAARPLPDPASHPLEALSPRTWRVAIVGSLVATAVLLVVLRGLEPVGASLESLARSGTPAAARRVLDTWGQAHSFRRAAFSIGLDYLLIPVYVTLLMLVCLRTRTRRWRLAGVTVAWLQLATAAFDVLENQGMIRVIEGGRRNTGVHGRWLEVTRFAYYARWGLVGVGAAFALVRALAWLLSKTYRRAAPLEIRVPLGEAQDRHRRLASVTALVGAAVLGITWFVKPVEHGPTLLRLVHSTPGTAAAIVTDWHVYGSIRAAYLAGLIPLSVIVAAATAALVATWGGPSALVRRVGSTLAALQVAAGAGGMLLAAALWRIVVNASSAPGWMVPAAVVTEAVLGIGLASGLAFGVMPWARHWWLDLREDGSPYPGPALGDERNFPSPKRRFLAWARGIPFEPDLPPTVVPTGETKLRGVCFSGGGSARPRTTSARCRHCRRRASWTRRTSCPPCPAARTSPAPSPWPAGTRTRR